jgi:polar amino acid transport system permease protein
MKEERFLTKEILPSKFKKISHTVLVALVLVGFVWISVHLIGLKLDFGTLFQYRNRLWHGFLMTILISIGSLVGSLFIGLIAALGQEYKVLFLQYFCKAYVQIIRGTPLLVQIYFFYYIIGTAWGMNNRYIAGIVILSLFEGAYIAEIIRGGIQSIARQKYEIALSLGLTSYQTFRFVTYPLVLSRIIPALAGQFSSIIKDSSLLSVIAVIELTQTTQEISADNFRMFENYIFVGFLYFLLTFAVSAISKKWEKRFHYERRI